MDTIDLDTILAMSHDNQNVNTYRSRTSRTDPHKALTHLLAHLLECGELKHRRAAPNRARTGIDIARVAIVLRLSG